MKAAANDQGCRTNHRHRQIERFLAALRGSHEHMTGVFLRGSCYELATILRTLYPDAEPWKLDGHVYVRIDGRFYDIRGRRHLTPEQQNRAVARFERTDPPHRWRNLVRERHRGFRPREHEQIRVTWHVVALRTLHRAWQELRYVRWRAANAVRHTLAIARSRPLAQRPAIDTTSRRTESSRPTLDSGTSPAEPWTARSRPRSATR